MENKVIVLVLGCNAEPYIKMQDKQKQTWFNNSHGIESFHYMGSDTADRVQDSNIYLKCNDSLKEVFRKTILAFKFLLDNNYSFTHIYRTNSSSYVNLDKLFEYVSTVSDTNFYGGLRGNIKDISFASGSGFLISRDLVKRLVDNMDTFDFTQLDDIGISKFIYIQNKIPITEIIRVDIPNETVLNTINKENVSRSFHYRVKSETSDRTFDTKSMDYIYNLLKTS